jgi:hypothetical protein
MWERVLDLSELSRLQPPAPLLSFMCAARRGPTTKSWLAPPIRARDQAGRQRPSLWPLDARWGQSNSIEVCFSTDMFVNRCRVENGTDIVYVKTDEEKLRTLCVFV